MRPTTSGLCLLLLFAVVFCATHPFHAVTRLEMPRPSAVVTTR